MSTNIQKNTRGVTKTATRHYKVDRTFVGSRTAEELVADLMRVHTQAV